MIFWKKTELKKVNSRLRLMIYKKLWLRYKFKYFIQSNNLYTLEKRSINGNNFKDVEQSIKIKWKFYHNEFNEKILIVRLIRDGSILEDNFREKGKNLQSLIKKEIIKQIHNPIKGYSEYHFKYREEEEYFYLDEESEIDTKGYIQLNKYYKWDYKSVPHCLIGSISGGGKTYLLLSLVKKMMAETSKDNIYMCDGKFDELEELSRNEFKLSNVAKDIGEIVNYIDEVNDRMEEIYLSKKVVEPIFLIIDEFASLQLVLNKKQLQEVVSKLKNIILKGRKIGVICVIALQRANGETIDLSIRENCALKIGLGNLSEENYKMIFGETKNIDELVRFEEYDKGKGYISFSGGEVMRFNAPVIVKSRLE